MSYLKFSVIIAFEGDRSSFERSMDYIFLQKYPLNQVEIIVVNNSDADMSALENYERQYPDSVVIINLEESLSFEGALNIGLGYASGDYVLFLKEGDILNVDLFEGLTQECLDDQPDLISFLTTSVMQAYDLFGYEDFDVENAMYYRFDNIKRKKRILNELALSENYHSFAYNRQFLIGSERLLEDEEFVEEGVFVYPLLLLAKSLTVIPEHGYCHYYVKDEESDENNRERIQRNLKAQLELYALLRSCPDKYREFFDLIDAHFVRKYYLHTIELFRGGRGRCLGFQQFQLMQITCIKLIPKIFYNDYIYVFSRRELDWLVEIFKNFYSDDQLESHFRSDAMVSVVMTTYNRAYILDRGIRDILQQSWQNFEFIIVNDNSSDDTEKLIQSFEDSRIRYIKNDKNKGVSFARNLGLSAAKGEYVIFQDDDDLSRLDKLEKMMMKMEKSGENVAAVYHEIIMLTETDGSDEYSKQIIPDREIDDVRKNGFTFPGLLPKNFITTSAILMKKKYLDEVGYFDEELIAYEDWELCLRLSKYYDFIFLREIMYDYLRGKTGLISSQESSHREKVLHSLYHIDSKYEVDRRNFNISSNFKIIE